MGSLTYSFELIYYFIPSHHIENAENVNDECNIPFICNRASSLRKPN